MLAHGATLGVDWTGPASRLTVAGTWERYFGDHYTGESPGLTWVRTTNGPDETRLRLTADWTNDLGVGQRMFTRVRAGVEHVRQFDFVPGHNRDDAMVQVQVGWRW